MQHFFLACVLPEEFSCTQPLGSLMRPQPGEASWHLHLSRCIFPSLQQDGNSSSKLQTKNEQPNARTYRQNDWVHSMKQIEQIVQKSAESLLLVVIYQNTSWWKMCCMDKENLTEYNTCKRKIKVNEHRTFNRTSHVHNWDLKRSLNLQAYIVLMGWIDSFL